MSWKLAELSWREELGLYESRWQRYGRSLGVKQNVSVASLTSERGRLRSQTGVAQCRPSKIACEAERTLGAVPGGTHTTLTGPRMSIWPFSSSPRFDTIASTVPLLQEEISSAQDSIEVREESDSESAAHRSPATRSRSCPALESPFFRSPLLQPPRLVSSPTTAHSEKLLWPSHSQFRAESAKQQGFDVAPKPPTPGASSADLTDTQIWPTPSDSLSLEPFHTFAPRVNCNLEAVESPTFEYLNHFLEHEGVIFEIINPPHNAPVASVVSAEDSSDTQLAPTESKHCSRSLLLPTRMASNVSGSGGAGNGASGSNGANGSHNPSQSRVRTIEELYEEYRPDFEQEEPRAPPNSRENGVVAAVPIVLTAAQFQTVGGSGSSTNAPVQPPANNPANSQQNQTGSNGSGSLNYRNGAQTRQVAGPPPDIPLPATPQTPLPARDTASNSTSPSGQYGRTSSVLAPSWLPSGLEQTPTSVGNSNSVTTPCTTRGDTYHGPSLSDIMEDPTENDLQRQASELSVSSGSTMELLLQAKNSGRSESRSAPSIGEGTRFVARDNSEESLSLHSNSHTRQDQEWETTEGEEDDDCSLGQTGLSLESLPMQFPLSSLPSDTSLIVSQHPVSTWDPLSAKNNLVSATEDHFANTLRSIKQKEQSNKGAGIGSRFTESLPDSHTGSDPFLQAAVKLAQPVDTSEDPILTATAIPLRRLFKRKTPKLVSMSPSTTQSAYGISTANTESMANLQATHMSAQHSERARLIDAEAELYDPAPRRPRQFPNAHLSVDRCHRIINDPARIAAQHKVGRCLLVLGTVFYLFGGFYLINSMAKGGMEAHNAMIEGCKALGLPVVGVLHKDEAVVAQKIEDTMLWVALGLCMAVLAVLLYAWVA